MNDQNAVAVLGPGWLALQSFADRQAASVGMPATSVLDPIGLLLESHPGGPWSYESTPANGITFASTGGDGVHFTALVTATPGPVVMTVPLNFGHENLVVGADVGEFLRLGCRSGFFILEQLSYRKEWAVDYLEHRADLDDEEEQLLAALRRDLGVDPPTDISGHLDDLQARYLHLVEPRGTA